MLWSVIPCLLKLIRMVLLKNLSFLLALCLISTEGLGKVNYRQIVLSKICALVKKIQKCYSKHKIKTCNSSHHKKMHFQH